MDYRFDGNKLLWHMDRVQDYLDNGKRIAPVHIDMAITKACNARCIYCYGYFQQPGPDMMPEQCVLDVMGTASTLGVRSMTLTGDGENTLNPALYPGLLLGHEFGLDIGLATNGIFLNKLKIETILRTCIWLRFNLSAVGREGYKKIHGVDQWEKVRGNIRDACVLKDHLKSKCTIGLQVVLTPYSMPYLYNEALFAIENKVDYMLIKQFSDPNCDKMSRFDMKWYQDEETIKWLKDIEGMSGHTKIVVKWNRLASMGKRTYDHCVDCAFLFQISGNSKCYPCGYLFNNEEYCYGDLKKQKLGEILKSERYWKIVNRMFNDFNVHQDCVGCCRHDSTNAFIWDYIHPPAHINFI